MLNPRVLLTLVFKKVPLLPPLSAGGPACDLCWRIFCSYPIRIAPKDKLKAAFCGRVNGSPQGELNFWEGKPVYRGQT